MNPQTVRFYFSFRSPFAAIAFYRLRRAPQFRDVTFEMMPVWPKILFGGHMDNPTDNLFKIAYVFQDAARQASLAGLDRGHYDGIARRFKLPEAADYTSKKVGIPMPDEPWEIPHAAFLYAASEGKGWAFGDAVMARHHNFDGKGVRNVMDPAVVSDIATQLGLDGRKAAEAVKSGDYDASIASITRQGERDGVFGVPFFSIDRGETRESFWGNDRLEYLLRSLRDCNELPEIHPSSLTEGFLRE